MVGPCNGGILGWESKAFRVVFWVGFRRAMARDGGVGGGSEEEEEEEEEHGGGSGNWNGELCVW